MGVTLRERCSQYDRSELLDQWHCSKNGELTPDRIAVSSNKKVWWRCTDGHEWKAVIYSRTGAKKCGCPVCSGRPSRRTRKSIS